VAKLGVEPDEDTARRMPELAPLLRGVPPARLFEETCKLFMTGHGMRSMEALQRFGLSVTLFPGLRRGAGSGKIQLCVLLRHALENTDERVRTAKPVTPAFLYAALLWSRVDERSREFVQKGDPEYVAIMRSAEEAIAEQAQRTAIPRRFSAVTRQIWLLQPRFAKTRGKRWKRLLYEERFRAGYDFLLLRAKQDPSLEPLCEFWTKAQENMEAPPVAARSSESRRDRPRRRYRRRAPSAG
jgi:poly(A) polymerase